MTYRVTLSLRAQNDLRAIQSYIRSQAPTAAQEWLRNARLATKTLRQHPERCPLAPERTAFDKPIRQLFFGSGNRGTYRFLFEVTGRSVNVLHVRHGSRLPLSPSDE
jgi:plasmid stabilization system protein ParE